MHEQHSLFQVIGVVIFLFIADKTFFIWASFFIVGLAFGYGSEVPDDPVFDCLKNLTYEGRECYVSSYF